ncbi:MAG: MazG nucleotide pyrophosphohydrolase domain-containing protein [bacterium]
MKDITIGEFQQAIEKIFGERDKKRGLSKSLNHLFEEMGELSQDLRKGNSENIEREFSDVLAWLATVANISGIDLEKTAERFISCCPRCGKGVCCCPEDNGYFDIK